MMKIMEMHAQNVICGPQKKKIQKKLFLAKLFTKNQKSIPNLPQVTLHLNYKRKVPAKK